MPRRNPVLAALGASVRRHREACALFPEGWKRAAARQELPTAGGGTGIPFVAVRLGTK